MKTINENKTQVVQNNIEGNDFNTTAFSFTDYTGIIASFLCFIHCWTLPLLLIVLPGLMTHNEWVNPVLDSIAIFSTIPILLNKSYKNHDKGFLFALIVGNLMLFILLFGHDHLNLVNEILISSTGGISLIYVHFKNLRFKHTNCKH